MRAETKAKSAHGRYIKAYGDIAEADSETKICVTGVTCRA